MKPLLMGFTLVWSINQSDKEESEFRIVNQVVWTISYCKTIYSQELSKYIQTKLALIWNLKYPLWLQKLYVKLKQNKTIQSLKIHSFWKENVTFPRKAFLIKLPFELVVLRTYVYNI